MNSTFPRTLSCNQKLLNNLLSASFLAAKKRRMSRVTDNINSFNNVWNNFTLPASDDESKIMAWLSPLEPQVLHQDICDQRVDGIGDWLLETKRVYKLV